MEIAALNVKIMFQKNETMMDGIGNHLNRWTDHYSCHATVSGEGGTEKSVAGIVAEASDIAFTVRFCQMTKTVISTGYRVLFQEELYDILSIDHLNYKKKALKFRCQKVRR